MDSASHLPKNEKVLDCLIKMKAEIVEQGEKVELGEPLRDLLNDFQIQLGDLHSAISESWFPKWD